MQATGTITVPAVGRGWHDAPMSKVSPLPDLAARLAPIEVTALDGSAVRLGSLWTEQPLLLVHLRHFG